MDTFAELEESSPTSPRGEKDQDQQYLDSSLLHDLPNLSIYPSEDKKAKLDQSAELFNLTLETLEKIKAETKLSTPEDQTKFSGQISDVLKWVSELQKNFQSLVKEEETPKIPQKEAFVIPSGFDDYLKQAKEIREDSRSLYKEVKSKIDSEIKEELSDVTMIISNLEKEQLELDEKHKGASYEKRLVKRKVESRLQDYQKSSQILELSSYIDALNQSSFTYEDEAKLAFIEDKLNRSRIAGASELYISEIYPPENLDLSKSFLGGPGGNKSLLSPEEEKELPPMRIKRSDSNDTLFSALGEFKNVTLNLDNYEMSVTDFMEMNSILQSNFYKSIDKLTEVQTSCLKRKLDSPMTTFEKENTVGILKKLKSRSYFQHNKKKGKSYSHDFEGQYFEIFTIFQQICKKEMNLDLVISPGNKETDFHNLDYIRTTGNKLFRLSFPEIDYDSILSHSLTMEKFNAEMRFYLAALLKLDPNLIRIIRLKKEEKGISIDIDIRKTGLSIDDLKNNNELIKKRFGSVSSEINAYMKKFNINFEDFNFHSNREYKKNLSVENRGGFPYWIPTQGWKRVGLNVHEKYKKVPPYNEGWLGTGGPECWAVGYHGLRYEDVEKPLTGIISGGFSRGWSNYHDDPEFQIDTGPNVTRLDKSCVVGWETKSDKPWLIPKVAQLNYLRPHEIDFGNRKVYTLIAFQCRIKPTEIRIPNLQRDYIMVNGPENVRAYGIMLKEVDKKYFDIWRSRYDFMGRHFVTDGIIYNDLYKVLEKGLGANMLEDFSVLGHKKNFGVNRNFKSFRHLVKRGHRDYSRPGPGWMRIGLNVDKLFPKIDWRTVMTRGLTELNNKNEWAVAYAVFDLKDPTFYRVIPQGGLNITEVFSEAEKDAESFVYENTTYKILLQVRFNPKKAIKNTKKIGNFPYKILQDYVLPYGILIKPENKTD